MQQHYLQKCHSALNKKIAILEKNMSVEEQFVQDFNQTVECLQNLESHVQNYTGEHQFELKYKFR